MKWMFYYTNSHFSSIKSIRISCMLYNSLVTKWNACLIRDQLNYAVHNLLFYSNIFLFIRDSDDSDDDMYASQFLNKNMWKEKI